MTKTLIVIDYQKEWTQKDSEYCVGDISSEIKSLNELISFCRKKGIPIIFTTHIEPHSEKAFAKGTENTEIIDDVDYQETDILIKKNKISPFFKTELETKLKALKSDELIITGILTNLCVRSCVSDAYDRDYKITVITDTCVTFSDDIHDFTLKDLKETRPEITFKTVDEFMA